jgi:pyridinium-3,5-bisthiocarboxylic acid mononucleotide nickel chelatase
MTIAYFDCFAGISGDMTLGALLDCGAERLVLDAAVEAMGLSDEVTIEVRHEARGHSGGTRVIVGVDDRVERTVPALKSVIADSDAPADVKDQALGAIGRLGRAEAAVHRLPEGDLHLHELGGADTLVDIVGAFWLLSSLEVDRVYASALPIAHPGPATLRILEGTGAQLKPSDAARELVTPTGAAILAAAATFERPSMALRRSGFGVGANESPGNLLGLWIGDEVATDDGVVLVETNLDDMAPNLLAALSEDLMEAGALDVAVVPAVMKKGRPGHLVTVMSPPDLASRLSELLLRHSTTLGVRLTPAQRVIAARRIVEVDTPLGSVRVKVKELAGTPVDVAPEFEDCRRIARESGRDLREVMRVADAAARRKLGLE